MNRRIATLGWGLTAMTAAVALVHAQDMPRPGSEHKAMAYFVGKWQTEGAVTSGDGKMTSTDTCEWFDGGFQVICKGVGQSPSGPATTLGVLAYNTTDKTYTYYGIDNSGTSELSTGSYRDKTWTFTANSTMGGEPVKSRFTMIEVSPTAYTFKWETSPDGSKWTEVLSGKSTKAGS